MPDAAPLFKDPVVLFQTVIDAQLARNWRQVADLCDPVSLLTFKRQLHQRLAWHEQHLRDHPAADRGDQPWWRGQLPGIDSVSTLVALPPEDVFARWLEGHSAQYTLSVLADVGKISEVQAANASAAIALQHVFVIGAVSDGPELAHVLYGELSEDASSPVDEDEEEAFRPSTDERALSRQRVGRNPPSVATCRRQVSGGWLLIADETLTPAAFAIGL